MARTVGPRRRTFKRRNHDGNREQVLLHCDPPPDAVVMELTGSTLPVVIEPPTPAMLRAGSRVLIGVGLEVLVSAAEASAEATDWHDTGLELLAMEPATLWPYWPSVAPP